MASSGKRKDRGSADVQEKEPYVVGIGASAGGLSALQTLLDGMPAEPGFSCVVVVHLSPDHESHLAQILQSRTPMPVQQVTTTTLLRPNRVYVIPPNANLDSIDTHLRLSQLEERRVERAPIDHFLRSLATTHDGQAIAVILTGAGSDGSLGLRHIKENGGLTIVQDPAEAEADSMPRSAIATGMVDRVLPLRFIADEILRYCATRPQLRVPDRDEDIDAGTGEQLTRVLDELKAVTHHDFSVYRKVALLKRLSRRMQLIHLTAIDDYLRVLSRHPEEAEALADDLQFLPTEFFRDTEVYLELERRILPDIFGRKDADNPRVRAWSIGCSTGEEAYSLAMLLVEESERHPELSYGLKVFASDSSEKVLTHARSAIYPREIAATVSAARLERFFHTEAGFLRVKRSLRQLVVFAPQNIFSDPPFAHLDVIICQTLLADLQPSIRRGLLQVLHYALEPDGVLLIGAHDEVEAPELFEAMDDSRRFLRRLPGPGSFQGLPIAMQAIGQSKPRTPMVADALAPAHELAAIHQRALEPFGPASVLVDVENTVLHFSSNVGDYIHIPGGELTHDITRLVREPLRSELLHGLRSVGQQSALWVSEPCVVKTYHGPRRVTLRLRKLSNEIVLIVFDDRASDSTPASDRSSEIITRLEHELEHVRARLLQSQAESLPSASVNLERRRLQDLADDLSVSREELRAVQQEALALDVENRERAQELAQVSTDLQHLLASTGIGTLFLDRDLRILRFTPLLSDLFDLRGTDIGRPLSDLSRVLSGDVSPEIDARRVLQSQEPIEREIPVAGHWYLSRMLPYRTESGRVDGIVLTLIDITERRYAEQAVAQANRRKDEFLAVLAHELRNPLAPIASGIELLRRACDDPRTVEKVAAIMGRQTKQLVRLVDDLLEVSRISSGKLRLRTAIIDLRDAVLDAVTSLRPMIENTGHKLQIEISEQALVVEGDLARLTQVITNLLSNAARYTPSPGLIQVSARMEGKEAMVTISDNGFGISSASQKKIFDMFYQGEHARASSHAGLGIGLTLVRSLVQMHGGSVAVFSEGTGRGSEFSVRLPLAPVALPAQRREPEIVVPGDKRILIVDDNVDAAENLSELIRRLGVREVRTAHGGSEALATAREFHPHVVLLDLLMPEMDGFELARRLRREPGGEQLLLIAVTGLGQDEHRLRSREAGIDRHLTKPADMQTLQTILKSAA